MSGVIDRDRGYNAIVARLKALDGVGAKVGILSSAGVHKASGEATSEPLDVAEIAAVHEFGNDGMPERSFLRAGIDGSATLISTATATLSGKVLDGQLTPAQAAGQLGLLGVREVQRKITDGPFVPNAPATIEAKGSSRPLIDSGQMRRAVTHEVVSGAELEAAAADAVGKGAA